MTRGSIHSLLAGVALAGLALPVQAYAQETTSAASDAADDSSTTEDIVVTGTLIRGVAPTGTNVVGVNSQDIVEAGATNTNQILARIPQVSSAFNATPSVAGSVGSGTTTVAPNLRNLSAGNGSATLLLFDGHRAVSAGVISTAPDPDYLPPEVLERVEVVPDGGSSIYGSDAVGGVINFITRKKFDGLAASARYGFADNYQTVDASVTAGRDWGTGSLYLAYAYQHNDAILGKDRGFMRQVADEAGYCNPGTVVITRGGTATPYALPGRTPGTLASCDYTDNASLYPRQTRHSVFASLYQELSPSITAEIKAFYTRRDVTAFVDLNNTPQQNGVITSSNPYYVPIAPDTGTQAVRFTFAGVYPSESPNRLDAFGITPSITADLGGGWQLRTLGNFGRSIVSGTTSSADAAAVTAALAGTTRETALNPYDVGASDPAVLQRIRRVFYGRGEQEMFNARSVLEGSLFSLPGGNVRLAAGGEIIYQTLDSRFGDIVPGRGAAAPSARADRTVKSGFGEIVVPIVGAGNSFGGVYALRLSASGRYDHYSDFGDTFNPKFGLTYQPVHWITVRGNWGKSFIAPSLADVAAADTRIVGLQVSPIRDPADSPANFFRPTIVLAGGNPDLKPQKAETWSLGLDVEPDFVPGLRLSATYYNISLRDQIAQVPVLTAGGAIFSPIYSQFVIKNPTLAQVQALAPGQAVQGYPSVEAIFAGAQPYVLLDARRNNLAQVKQDGLDFDVSYNHETGFGSIAASVGGTYTLKRKIAPIAGAAFSDELVTPGASDLRLVANLGAKVGNLFASATLSHSGGYKLNPVLTTTKFGTQTRVKSFNTVDLFFQYDIAGDGMLSDLALTLNVNNVFDQDPPFFNATGGNGYTNGSTLGRLVQLGVRKKF